MTEIIGSGGFGGGKGGGGGSAGTPTTAPDTLQSKSYARVLDLISEGEIQGLVDGNKSIFLNDTALLASSGVANFLGFNIETRNGTQSQSYIPGFPGIEEEFAVGQQIEAANNILGTWERDWIDTTYERPAPVTGNAAHIEIAWEAHGLTTGDQVFCNFAKYNTPHDALYSVTVIDVDNFYIVRKNALFKSASGQVYVIKPRLKITATGTWTGGSQVYIRFMEESSDSTRATSTIYTKTGTYNNVYTILSSPAPSGSEFYINWTDKPGALKGAQIDGGVIRLTTATYSKSGSTITVNKPSHGFTSGMAIELLFLSGSLSKTKEVFNIVTASTNSFTVTRTNGANTGSGTYYVEVPQTSSSITRSIVNSEVDRVRVTISVPVLQSITNSGNIVGSSFYYALDVQLNGGGFQQIQSQQIKGKSSGGYSFAREITLSSVPGWNSSVVANNFPLDIRLRRVNEDSDSPRTGNAFNWQSYTEIIDAKLRYPNTALVGIEIDAEQFNSIPRRTYLIKGIKVRIPSNATVDSSTGRITYSGTWDGTFAAATWCSDPAWILWDILTNRRYGFGEQILTDAEKASFNGNASRLDKWSFYAASQYANELVATGLPAPNPSQEPRFSCNVTIQNSEEAFTLVNNLLSVFRSQGYWAGGGVTLAQDRPQDASYLFGPSNVVGGNFAYQGSDLRTRPTVAVVRYLDLDTRDTATEVVEDATLISKYGIVKQEIEAFACTSQSQAARVGRWLLYSSQYETETVTFSIATESGVVLRPGMIINIADPVRSGTRMSGRVSSATTTAVVIDVNRTINAGDTLSVVLPNGLLETRTVSNYVSGTRTVTVSSAFSVAPQANTIWLLSSSTVSPTSWRVVGVAENSAEGIFEVSALAYDSSKYAYIESGATLQKKKISVLNAAPDAPTNLSYSEALYADNKKVFTQVSVSWNPVPTATVYQFRYRVGNGNWVNLPESASTQQDIFNAPEGNWQVEIVARNSVGKKSNPATLEFLIVGKTAPPAALTALEISPIDSKTAELGWPAPTDLDVLVGGKIIIRHTPVTVNPEWQDCNDIIPAVAGNATKAVVPLIAGTYMAKAEDSTGNRSVNPITVKITLPEPLSPLSVITFNEDTTSPPFQGNLTNMLYSADQDALILDQGVPIDELAPDGDFDALPSIDGVGDIVPEGEYEFGSTLDLGGIYDTDMRARFVTRAFLPGDLWDDKLDLIDAWGDIDGSTLDKVNATLYVRSTNNDPAGNDPVFTDWQPLVNGTRQGRGFEFKVVATSTDVTQNILIDELGATVELPRRQESGNNITSGAGAYAVTFANAFYATPSIGISGQNMATGDFFALSAISRTGFTVTFRNSAGTAVSRSFDYTAVGYGKQLP
jgi:predicted phage tail protein